MELLEAYPQRHDDLCGGFVRSIAHNGDRVHADQIVYEIERRLLRRDKIPSVVLWSARPLAQKQKDALRAAIHPSSIVTERIDSLLGGGVKVVVDETTMIDATLVHALKQLFPQSSLTA